MSPGLKNLLKTWTLYSKRSHWLLSAYNRALIKFPKSLPLRGKVISVEIKGQNSPLFLRLGSTDFWVLEEVFSNEEYAAVPAGVVANGGLIVDLGANIGISVRYWLARWPGANVIAVEPEPSNAQLLRMNLSAVPSQKRQWRVLEACVGGVARMERLINDGGEWGCRLSPDRYSAVGPEVGVMTMEEVLADLPDQQMIDVLKCDIEGAEMELFENCRRWIGRVRCIAVEVHAPYTLASVLAAINRSGANFRVIANSGDENVCLAVLVRHQL
jgi:FkbM family methyltransferase